MACERNKKKRRAILRLLSDRQRSPSWAASIVHVSWWCLGCWRPWPPRQLGCPHCHGQRATIGSEAWAAYCQNHTHE